MAKTSNIVSCLIVDDELIAREIIASHLSTMKNIEVVAMCSDAVEAFNQISQHHVDLIFLDINMPKISGISFAKSINKNIKIIFTTAYREYAVEGFELQAVDYLLKPISRERLQKALNNYIEIHRNSEQTEVTVEMTSEFMFVRSNRKMIKIDFEDIIYVESYGDYVKLHLTTSTIVTRDTISAIEAKLPKHSFIRIHRSFVISIKSIQSFTNEYITINNKAIPISRSYKKVVLERLEKY